MQQHGQRSTVLWQQDRQQVLHVIALVAEMPFYIHYDLSPGWLELACCLGHGSDILHMKAVYIVQLCMPQAA
jgi:hypothetical protein